VHRIASGISLIGISLALVACQPSPAPTAAPAPIQSQPTQAVQASPTSPVVLGSIRISEGENVVSGIAGQPLKVTVHYAASSSAGPITQMRTAQVPACAADISNSAAWEPFAPEKNFTIPALPTGVTAFDVSVQYRDSQGNVSLFYCEDGAVEGTLSTSTP
jgi:hypothetical protein